MSVERLAAKLVPTTGRKRRLAQVVSFSASTLGPPPLPPRVNVSIPGAVDDDGSPFVVRGVPYLSTYAPSNGDWIWIDTSGPDWFVIGKRA